MSNWLTLAGPKQVVLAPQPQASCGSPGTRFLNTLPSISTPPAPFSARLPERYDSFPAPSEARHRLGRSPTAAPISPASIKVKPLVGHAEPATAAARRQEAPGGAKSQPPALRINRPPQPPAGREVFAPVGRRTVSSFRPDAALVSALRLFPEGPQKELPITPSLVLAATVDRCSTLFDAATSRPQRSLGEAPNRPTAGNQRSFGFFPNAFSAATC
jgi:hypothetical protein